MYYTTYVAFETERGFSRNESPETAAKPPAADRDDARAEADVNVTARAVPTAAVRRTAEPVSRRGWPPPDLMARLVDAPTPRLPPLPPPPPSMPSGY